MTDEPCVTGRDAEILALFDAGRPVSASTYTNHGCRCDGCLAAVREVNRAYRARHPEQEAKRVAHAREMRRLGLWSTGQ